MHFTRDDFPLSTFSCSVFEPEEMPHTQPTKPRKKPPACDACKKRRVLCHPQPAGRPCPRCEDRGVQCTTTPLPRGRPPKLPLDSTVWVITPAPRCTPESPPSTDTSSTLPPEDFEDAVVKYSSCPIAPSLPFHLVHHLFECFVMLPTRCHALLEGTFIRDALVSVNWNPALLRPHSRVLAYCIMAHAAVVSSHAEVIGPGPQPSSSTDTTVFFPGADLRSYGRRRAPFVKALHDAALRLAMDEDILLIATEETAASCYYLGTLDCDEPSTSRPWSTAYISHVRSISASINSHREVAVRRALWAVHLMADGLHATAVRKPVIVTLNDQLLVCGPASASLADLMESFHVALGVARNQEEEVAFLVLPYCFHATRLARELWEEITGDLPRRNPLSEITVRVFLLELEQLRQLLVLWERLVEKVESSEDLSPTSIFRDMSAWTFCNMKVECPKTQMDYMVKGKYSSPVRACMHAMMGSWPTLALALHREFEWRFANDASLYSCPDTNESFEGLRQQAHRFALLAVQHVVEAVGDLPPAPSFLYPHLRLLCQVADVCLDDPVLEGNVALGDIVEQRGVSKRILNALKLSGYMCDSPLLDSRIARLEAKIADKHTAADKRATGDLAWEAWLGLGLPDVKLDPGLGRNMNANVGTNFSQEMFD